VGDRQRHFDRENEFVGRSSIPVSDGAGGGASIKGRVDFHGRKALCVVSHTVEVMAATLYEAVARGVAALRGNEWVAGIAQGPSVVKVSVADVRVEHEVKFLEFLKWLDRPPRSPRDVSARREIRSILGMPVGR